MVSSALHQRFTLYTAAHTMTPGRNRYPAQSYCTSLCQTLPSFALVRLFSCNFSVLEHEEMTALGNRVGYTCMASESSVGPRGEDSYLPFSCPCEDLSLATARITSLIQHHSAKPAGEQQQHFFISAAEALRERWVCNGTRFCRLGGPTALPREAPLAIGDTNVDTEPQSRGAGLLG